MTGNGRERETSKSKSEETARESCHFWMARFALPAYGELLVLPPHHTVDDARVALDDLHDLGGDVLVRVVRHGHRGQRPPASRATAVRTALSRPRSCLREVQMVFAIAEHICARSFKGFGAPSTALNARQPVHKRVDIRYWSGNKRIVSIGDDRIASGSRCTRGPATEIELP